MSLMGLLLETTVKSSLVVLAALVAVACLRRRSAALRHWILSAAIVAAMVSPALGLVTPSWHVPLDAIARPQLIGVVAPPAQARRPAQTPADTDRREETAGRSMAGAAAVVSTAWLAGAGAGLLLLLIGLGRLTWIASTARRVDHGPWAIAAREVAREYGLRRPVVILQTDHPALLVTWGFVQPKVILPRTAPDWPADRIRVVLAHELAHIKRGDWLIQMVGEIARAGYWFNPVMWVACRRLRLESEQATDDVVLHAGINGSEYASHLLELARAFSRGGAWLPAPAIARPSSLERRVSAMLNTRINRAPTTRAARLGIVAALSAVAMAIASAQGAFSTFSGTVFDPMNGYLPGVTMTLTNTQSGAKHEIRSDRTGHFEFVGLPPGSYSLQAILPGFSVLTGTLDLTGRDVQRDVTLKVGQLTETISVWASRDGAAANPPSSPPVARRPAPDKVAMMKECAERTPTAGSMGGNLRQPMKLVDVKPRYPQELADAAGGGVFVFAAVIGTDGTVRDLQTTAGTNPDLELAASTAIRQWEFTPTLLNCVAVEVPMTITVTFKPAP
jgi:beta-lactamase regulating signal transducer with metallopeptidase domain